VQVTLDESILTTLSEESEEVDITNLNLRKAKESLTESTLKAHYVNSIAVSSNDALFIGNRRG